MIVFSDFDNTLYTHDNTSFERNLKSIQEFREKGNKFCIATGRNRASLERIWPDCEEYLDYSILDNGAVCLDRQGKELFREMMPPKIVEAIIQMVKEQYGDEEVQVVFYYDTKEWQEPGLNMTKLRCWAKNRATSESICNAVNTAYGSHLRSFVARVAMMTSLAWIKDPEQYNSFVDIVPMDAGKHNAVRRLSELYPSEQVVTIGDDTNDLEMIREFNGYAMRDSMPEVLETVDQYHIVESVADLLERL